jgi:hypothetical protein
MREGKTGDVSDPFKNAYFLILKFFHENTSQPSQEHHFYKTGIIQ